MRSVTFFSAPDIIHLIKSTRMRWVEHVVCMWGGERCIKVLVQKCEGERLLGRPGYKW
jgi:hypothetical protein